MDKKCEKDSFVSIAAVIGGILFVSLMMFVIFAREQTALIIPMSWAFVTLGIVLGFFKYKSMKK